MHGRFPADAAATTESLYAPCGKLSHLDLVVALRGVEVRDELVDHGELFVVAAGMRPQVDGGGTVGARGFNPGTARGGRRHGDGG